MSKSVSNVITQILAVIGCVIAIMLTIEHFRPDVSIGCQVVGGDCHSTIESRFGHVGPIPTSLIGLAMYAVIFGICVVRGRKLTEWKAAEEFRAAAYSGAGPDPVSPDSESSLTDTPASFSSYDSPDHSTHDSSPESSNDSTVVDSLLRNEIRKLDVVVFTILALAFATSWYLQYFALYTLCAFCPWCLSSAITVSLMFLIACGDTLIVGRKINGEARMLIGVTGVIAVLLSVMYWPEVSMHVKGCWINRATPISIEGKRDTLLRSWVPYKGDPNAKCYIIEFADYGCPHCKKGSARIDEFLNQHPHLFQLGFRNFPLGHFRNSRVAAIAALAAGRQNKFWEMHDILFQFQDELNEAAFDSQAFGGWAKMLNLDVRKFSNDMADPKLADTVDNDHSDGAKNSIKSTPTFYLIPKDPSKQITMFTGLPALEELMRNPNSEAFK